MTALDDVKKWMTWIGWTEGGGIGSQKLDADGAPKARHGDAVWIADVDEAIAKVEREKIKAEFERRDRERGAVA